MFKRLLNIFENSSYYTLAVFFAISGCLSYWTYLFFTTEMIIIFDAQVYEGLGRLILEKGWGAYFQGGPEREPFYTGTIAFSMKLGQLLSLHYQHFQKMIQLGLFFTTQLLLLYLLDRLKIHNLIKLITITYFGFSPSLVNAALSLFSEIIAFPFVLLVVIFLGKSWQALYERNGKDCAIVGFLSAVFFLLLTLGKGAFQLVYWVTVLPFLAVSAGALWKSQFKTFKNSLSFIIVFVLVFNAGILGMKLLNQKYNGHFTFSGKYNFTILGSAIKRSKPITKEILLSHIASIPGTGICLKFFDERQCDYADWYGAVDATDKERKELLNAYPENEKADAMISLAITKAGEHPFRFGLFTILESFKMFFWESTKVGFVRYPPFLERLYDAGWFRYGLRFGMSVLTIISAMFVLFKIFKEKAKIFKGLTDDSPTRLVFVMIIFIVAYVGIYASCYIITRYALPIASLFLISIAIFINALVPKKMG